MIKATIYIIKSPHTDKVYVGSTVNSLNKRKSKHYNDFSRYNRKILHYKTSYDVIKEGDCMFETLAVIEVPNKLEMYKLESFYIKQYPTAVNKQKPANQHPLLCKEHTCSCGTTCFLSSLTNHVRSKKHIAHISK
jgi:hypothetical protein